MIADLMPFDAKVITLTECTVLSSEKEGYWVISSPNTSWVPTLMFGVQEVYLHADGQFTWEDQTL